MLAAAVVLAFGGGLALGRYVVPASGADQEPEPVADEAPRETPPAKPPRAPDHVDEERRFGLSLPREEWRFVPADQLPEPHRDAAVGLAGPDNCLGLVRVVPRPTATTLEDFTNARLAAVPIERPEVMWHDAVVYDAEGTARRFQVRGQGPSGPARVQVTVLYTLTKVFEVTAWSGAEFLPARRCFDFVTAAFYRLDF